MALTFSALKFARDQEEGTFPALRDNVSPMIQKEPFHTLLGLVGDQPQQCVFDESDYHPNTNEGRVGKSVLSTGLASSLTHTSGNAWRRASMLR
jgi:hypothetical protein